MQIQETLTSFRPSPDIQEEAQLRALTRTLIPLLKIRGGRGPHRYTDPQLCLWATFLAITDERGETSTQVAARLGCGLETVRRQRRRVLGRLVRTDHIPLPPIDYSIQ